jgi:hypothetical protein
LQPGVVSHGGSASELRILKAIVEAVGLPPESAVPR